MRKSKIIRGTNETEIIVKCNLDGAGKYRVSTGVPFFNHMLELFAMHSQMDLEIECKGDTDVDAHHSVEDCGIVLGQALKEALGDKKQIARYATKFLPMDETLVYASLDISGRPYFIYNVEVIQNKVGDFDAELAEEFFRAFAVNAGFTLHINMVYGRNTHHILEACFKAVGQAVRAASKVDAALNGVLSTKGTL